VELELRQRLPVAGNLAHDLPDELGEPDRDGQEPSEGGGVPVELGEREHLVQQHLARGVLADVVGDLERRGHMHAVEPPSAAMYPVV